MTTLARKLSIHDRLSADHRHLESLYEKLLEAFDAGAREDTQAYWGELDAALERHLGAEEEVLFPRFGASHADELARLRAEHAGLRRQLAELGAGVDLKLVRCGVAHAFIDSLRAHAAREDALLYRWAEQLPAAARQQLEGRSA